MATAEPVSGWPDMVASFLSERVVSSAGREALEPLRARVPSGLSRALDPDHAEAAKTETTGFFLHVVEHALADHALTSTEVEELIALRHYFRIQEGDLQRHHPEIVSHLLCREAEQALGDAAIDPREALHKAQLQDLFGLGYDEFLAIIAPVVDALRRRFADHLLSSLPETWFGDDPTTLQQRLTALDLVQFMEFCRRPNGGRAGFIYLLVNPSMPGMVKVGRTTNPPAERAAQLTGATGVPTPFMVAFELAVPDCVAAEAYVHQRLSQEGHRVADNREFFAVEPSVAVRLMLEAAEQ